MFIYFAIMEVRGTPICVQVLKWLKQFAGLHCSGLTMPLVGLQFLQLAQYSVAGQCDSRINQASGPAVDSRH